MPEEMVHDLLVQIAHNIDKNGPDPILEDVDCHWHGEYSQGHPIIHLQKPGEPNPAPTYVNRIMALLFASNQKFLELQQQSKAAFPMSCGHKTCITFQHLS